MQGLFDKNYVIDADIKRNITSLIKSEDLFDDLYAKNDHKAKNIAIAIESRIKKAPTDFISRGFLYTTSIEYPFKTENYHSTRYGDGSYPCWYGSLTEITTIYETAYHNLIDVIGTEGIQTIIIRERALYNIHCKGILIDLSKQKNKYKDLLADDYIFTQSIGKRIYQEGHPGLLAPSARDKNGTNVVIFNKNILSNPRQYCNLRYFIDPIKKSVRVEKQPEKELLTILNL
jgi:hypothetical protein